MPSEEHKPIGFARFGGLRLDQAIDEVGGENAIYLRDVDWDGTTGKLRPRDGFQKLKAADATGPYKGLFAHSSSRMFATKRVSSESLKLVAIDREGVEKKETALNKAVAKSCFARFGTPSASYTYMRTNTAEQKVVRFDGTEFKEPTATLNKNPDGSGGETGKEMPKGAIMLAWPAGDNRFVVLNTGSTGGPGGAASSSSHGWFSDPGDAESWHTDPETQAGEANYFIFGAGDGEEITDGCAWGGMVFVFKETKLFIVYGISEDGEGRPEFDVREVVLGEGSRMKRSGSEALAESSDRLATAAPSGVYFCCSDGIWATTGGEPAKVSQALRPLEEVSSFDGPMADFLDGDTEVCRWPAAGIVSLGQRIIVKRYEYLFVLDLPTGDWTCWYMPQVSLAVWTGLTGGGPEVSRGVPAAISQAKVDGTDVVFNALSLDRGRVTDGSVAVAGVGNNANSSRVSVTDLGNDLPEDATVRGIEVSISRMGSESGQTSDFEVRLLKAGTPVGSNKASASIWGNKAVIVVYGGPEDLWGEPWTPAQINASEFGVGFRARNGTPGGAVSLDGFVVSIYYATTEASSGVRPRLFCTQGKSVFFTQPSADEDAGTRDAEWQSGFYDLGSEDEKTLVASKVWGQGEVTLAGYRDLEEAVDFEDELSLGEDGFGQDRGHSTQTATLFSHRLKLSPGSSVQRVVRYLRETRTAGTETP